MNKFICEHLMSLQKIYESEQDVGRKIAYLKAVSTIRSMQKDIVTVEDVDNVKGIGSKIRKKIK